jgi:hypothetical protein
LKRGHSAQPLVHGDNGLRVTSYVIVSTLHDDSAGNCRGWPAATAEDIMHTDHHSFGGKITRRSLVTGAAAGTLALASDPASA